MFSCHLILIGWQTILAKHVPLLSIFIFWVQLVQAELHFKVRMDLIEQINGRFLIVKKKSKQNLWRRWDWNGYHHPEGVANATLSIKNQYVCLRFIARA